MTEAARSAAEEAYVGTNEVTRAVMAQVAEGVARVAEERVNWEGAVSEARGRQYSYAGRRSETMDEGLLNQAMDRRMTPPAADPDVVFVEGVRYSQRKTSNYYGVPFDDQVRALINGQIDGDGMLLIGRTPKILRDIGLSDLPMMMDQNHARKLREGTTS